MDNICPCVYCADEYYNRAQPVFTMLGNWFYIQCKYDKDKTYTWTEMMEVYIIYGEMGRGRTLVQAQQYLKEQRGNYGLE